jgi:hypothetical protein
MKAPNKIEFTTNIKNGKWLTNISTLKKFNEAWDGCQITVTLHMKRNRRSNNQNSYYFSFIVPILQKCIENEWQEYWDKSAVHEFLLSNFNYDELINEETGEILRKVRRSKDNDTKQAEVFYQRCREFILEYFNTEVPLPNESVKLEFE